MVGVNNFELTNEKKNNVELTNELAEMKQSECLRKATAVSATKDVVQNHIRIAKHLIITS